MLKEDASQPQKEKRILSLFILVLFVFVSGISVAYSVHVSRKHVSELSRLTREQDEIQVEWEKLQVEINMLAAYNRVELNAREHLGMHAPDETQVRVIHLDGEE